MAKKPLTAQSLRQEASRFAIAESNHDEPRLYGVTDGKAVGTYLEHKFREHLAKSYSFEEGNSANGIDFPNLNVDMKVTSVRQPQSSCPFKSARQKVYGLGYALLVFIYDKSDDDQQRTGRLDIQHTIYIEPHRTGDFTTTRILSEHITNGANSEDLIAVMRDRNLPVDDVEANNLAEELLQNPPDQGYVTISNALQWRLQYGRAIEQAGSVTGVIRL
jgi:hypothetical protein